MEKAQGNSRAHERRLQVLISFVFLYTVSPRFRNIFDQIVFDESFVFCAHRKFSQRKECVWKQCEFVVEWQGSEVLFSYR